MKQRLTSSHTRLDQTVKFRLCIGFIRATFVALLYHPTSGVILHLLFYICSTLFYSKQMILMMTAELRLD